MQQTRILHLVFTRGVLSNGQMYMYILSSKMLLGFNVLTMQVVIKIHTYII